MMRMRVEAEQRGVETDGVQRKATNRPEGFHAAIVTDSDDRDVALCGQLSVKRMRQHNGNVPSVDCPFNGGRSVRTPRRPSRYKEKAHSLGRPTGYHGACPTVAARAGPTSYS